MSSFVVLRVTQTFGSMLRMKKLLPDTQRLRALRDEGKTYREIAAWVEAKTGEKVSPATIGSALSRAGLTSGAHRYVNHLPWVVRAQHITAYPARMLRALGRRDNGLPLSDLDNQRLDSWLKQLREEHALVAYVPESEQGFYYVDGDWPEDNIPIVRPRTPGRRAS